MSDTREWLTDVRLLSKGDQTAAGQVIRATVDALLAVLDECDHADARIMLRGSMASADVRDAINEALGVTNE